MYGAPASARYGQYHNRVCMTHVALFFVLRVTLFRLRGAQKKRVVAFSELVLQGLSIRTVPQIKFLGLIMITFTYLQISLILTLTLNTIMDH